MAEFKLGRIRFVWKNDWAGSTTYYRDDVIAYGGKIYMCVIGHTSNADFFTDLDVVPSKWNIVSEGQTWKGDWATSTYYVYDDIVKYGARLYICNTVHTSDADANNGLEADQVKWTVFAEGLDWKGDWTTSTRYKVNDFVKYGGYTYVCKTVHTSASSATDGLEVDLAKWEVFNAGMEYTGDFAFNTRYKLNDTIRYGSSIYICTTAHTSGTKFDGTKWTQIVEGLQNENEWVRENTYQQGDIVRYGGNLYVSKQYHTEKTPASETAYWDLFAKGMNFVGEYGADSSQQDYRPGDVVTVNGYTYLNKLDSNGVEPGLTSGWATYWDVLNEGFEWRSEWIDDREYKTGDIVRYQGNTYVCIQSHVSEGDDGSSLGGDANSRPDLDATGTYWNVFTIGTETSVLTTKGDMVYYGGAGPTRLPIGKEGQVLKVAQEGIPEWAYLGLADDVYYVSTVGQDLPAPEWGRQLDKAWASIRYACEQVEKGTKNPLARELLELNKFFIQRETVEWIDYQVANATPGSIWENFEYAESKCERDMGYIVEAIVWDITHGGNVKSRESAISYVNDAQAVYTKNQEEQTVEAINYALSVMQSVLNQTAPATNYQTTNGDNSTAIVEQYFNANIEAEDVYTEIAGLVEIITDAITAGSTDNIPARIIRNALIKVATGQYQEVLPIRVPAEVCVIGDELRSTNVQPRKASNGTLTPKKDTPFSYQALVRLEDIIGEIVAGSTVDATTGNNETQTAEFPFAAVAQEEGAETAVRNMRRNIDWRLGDKLERRLPDAPGGTTDNVRYVREAALINKDFIKAEVIAYITANYPNVKYSKTKCKQDTGYIIDAITYDLMYGGNWQSINAGLAYYTGATGTLQIDTSEKTPTLAAYAFIKTRLNTICKGQTVAPTLQDDVAQVVATGGNQATVDDLLDKVDDIITTIRDGYDNAPTTVYPTVTSVDPTLVAASTAINNYKATIQEDVIDFISKNFGSFKYNSATCRRDLDRILTDLAYDVALNTNYNAVFNGTAYRRPINAYNLQEQRTETIGAIRFARDEIKDLLADSTAITRSNAAFNEIVDIIENDTADALSLPTGFSSANQINAAAQLQANKTFIKADVIAYIANTYPALTYDQTKCERDVDYILDALRYDILYGGDSASTRIAQSYFSSAGAVYPVGQTTETAAAYTHLKSIVDDIILESAITPQAGNVETQDTSGTAGSAAEVTVAEDNLDRIISSITAGNTDGLSATTFPDLSALGVSATLQTEAGKFDTNKADIIVDTIQYINTTYNDFNYNQAKCSRDIGLILDAARYDIMLGTNFAGIVAGYAYLREQSSKVYGDQKTATIAANEFARKEVLAQIGNNILVNKRFNDTWEFVQDSIFMASTEGGMKSTAIQNNHHAIRQLELNKEFLVSEVHAYVDDFFQGSINRVNADNGYITTSTTEWLKPLQPISFSDADDSATAVAEAGLDDTVTYYVKDIIDEHRFTISATEGGSVLLAADGLRNSSGFFAYDRSTCRRDIGYILDGVGSDIATGSNFWQVTNGLAYRRANANKVISGQLAETAAGITKAKELTAALKHLKSNSTALIRSNNAFDEIIDILNNGTGNADALSFPAPSNATANTQNAVAQLIANRTFLAADTVAYVDNNTPPPGYDATKCERDVGYLIDALCFDIMYGGNSASVNAAKSYFVGTESQLGSGESAATVAAYNHLASIASDVIQEIAVTPQAGNVETQDTSGTAASATEGTLAQTLLQITEDVIDDGNLDNIVATTYPDLSWADEAYVDIQYIIEDSKSRIQTQVIKHLDTTYAQLFKASTAYNYNMDLCSRDVREYIDAVKWDLQFPQEFIRDYTDSVRVVLPGNYKSHYAPRFYANAVTGSQEEDFFYLRNGTGLRLMTLQGLDGDLGPENSVGVSKPTAGAYASLDPGWGPNDERVWITARSPYVQNVTTFGNAAVGQKIDGALHNGGNDSIVSNDFTQVISDGIGAWILNNGRAELVSVFTYYAHVGYLAETGGRVRATNGNNSYGDWGSVAIGVDPDETATTGIVDNRLQYNATVSNVEVDGDNVLALEFNHAGNDYTKATLQIFGSGQNAETEVDEFRDNAVNRIRPLDLDDSSGTLGGSGYLVVENTAQTGTTTSITLAATDGNIDSAYPGMKVYITGGAAVGQYAIIDTYDSGSKVATVVRETDGVAGWNHTIEGTAITNPTSSSTYRIEPAVSFTEPPHSSDAHSITSTAYDDVIFGRTQIEYTGVNGVASQDGKNATFDVTRDSSKYYPTLSSGGTGYKRLETITISGADLGGTTPENDLVLTITAINTATGAVVAFDQDGLGLAGRWLAADGNTVNHSIDKDTWTAATLPGTASTVTKLANGQLDDGSTNLRTAYTVAVGQSASANAAWYSTDGVTWTAATYTGHNSEPHIAFGSNSWVSIHEGSTAVYRTTDGINWSSVGTLPGTGYAHITYGAGTFIAINPSTNASVYSVDAGATWVVGGSLAAHTWVAMAYGNSRFIAVNNDGNSCCVSVDNGVNWTERTMPDVDGSSINAYTDIAYGQGVFVAVSDVSGIAADYNTAAVSEDGVNWTTKGFVDSNQNGSGLVAFGNPNQMGTFFIVESGTANEAVSLYTGARARGRVGIANEQVFEVRLVEPGSNYTNGAPTMTITDPNNIYDGAFQVRLGSGCLASPSFLNRGSSYQSASSEIFDDTSDGYADFFQTGTFVAVRRLTERPVPGSNVVFDSLPDRVFKLVNVVSFLGDIDGTYTAFLNVSPEMTTDLAPEDGDGVTMRIRYSQVRLTGHDFLDIGTGGLADTNYPGLPTQDPDNTKETNDADGGRVFFTSTDQDGNFRVGDLFSIEQSTGVATLNAEAFNIAGLQELSLGEVTLGGNSASITEFSTDPFFTANSDTIVPTQRAIKSYIEAQIGGGGASLNVNTVTAGDIFVGTNIITTVSGEAINIRANMNFEGGVTGLPVAYNYFLR